MLIPFKLLHYSKIKFVSKQSSRGHKFSEFAGFLTKYIVVFEDVDCVGRGSSISSCDVLDHLVYGERKGNV